MADIIEVIKKASKEAEEQSSPSDVLFGTVVSVNPIEIQIEQKLTLTKEFLIFTKNVIDYEVEVSLNWKTNDKTLNTNHGHSLTGSIEVSSTINPNTNNQTINNNVNSSINIENAEIDVSHNHNISGTKSIIIHNALKQGDKVILMQQRGGQKFVVLDKIY